ncbi:MAG TPA: glycoside hydrolase family 15 protein [Solirubrobacteraceae bacterium]|jgi:GH15 family glucan-1,4-alpha-glucosidase|nr:glycoside hydrolase family 15 protein [Solirubrobacteraceae bacterium]
MRDVVANVPLAASPFPQIADYGFLSDCEATALVAPSGQVEWMCVPRMDSPSLFGAILDRDAGMFALAPAEARVPAGQRYIPGTNILETTWGTKTGWLIVRDVLLVGPWRHDRERSHTHRRSPTDYDAEHVLLRTMRCVNGQVQVAMECDPIYDYGRAPATWEYSGRAYEECTGTFAGHDLKLTLNSDLRLGIEGSTVRARTTMHDGDSAFVALSWSDHPGPKTWEDAYGRLVRTADFWHEWIAQGEFPDHPWRRHLQRSALTLKGLVYAPTGAMCAAATTSLPETPGGERNWDYRYSWVRDSTFMLWALYTLGFDWEADDFFHFIAEACADADLQVMYGIGGERELDEEELNHLEGYEHSQPVRIGNAAYRHQQHDVWGSALDSFYLHTKTRDGLRETYWPMLCKQVEKALTHWREPDRGIWEVRGEPKHFTSSKIMCWVAADRGARLARLREDAEKTARWQAAADEIRADVLAHAVDERGVLTQHYGTKALDASLLLAPLVRFLPSDDERIVNTVNAIDRELTVHGLVLRYKVDETDDGLGAQEEGTFTICSFWLVSALSEIGETQRARDLCERLLSYASPLLLYGEELDPLSGRHLGNFPQAFTHLALINAAMHVIRADRQLALEQQPLDSTRRER